MDISRFSPPNEINHDEIKINLFARNEKSYMIAAPLFLPLIPMGNPSRTPKHFHLYIDVCTQNDSFTIEPLDMVLIFDGNSILPDKFKGPFNIDECDSNQVNKTEVSVKFYKTSDKPIKIDKRQRFIIRFPIRTKMVEKEFSLNLKGMKRNGIEYKLPEILFYYHTDYDYWLPSV